MELYFSNKTRKSLDVYESKYLALFEKTLNYLNLGLNYSMSVTFVSLKKIKEINTVYRNINRPTDVISFAYLDDIKEKNISYEGMLIDLGEIYICYDVAIKNAKKYGNSDERELCFLYVHGLLHLLGYDHMKKEDEEVMFSLQDKILPPTKKEN